MAKYIIEATKTMFLRCVIEADSYEQADEIAMKELIADDFEVANVYFEIDNVYSAIEED